MDRTDIDNLRELIRASTLPVWLVDLETSRVIEASVPLAELLGTRRENILERHALDFAADEAAARARLDLLASEELNSYHVRARGYRRADGTELLADTCATAVMDGTSRRIAIVVLLPVGSPLPMVALGPKIVDAAALGTVDESWRIDRISADVEELLGYPAADLVGEPLASLVQPGDWPSLLIAVGHSLAGEGSTSIRLRLRAADGQVQLCTALVTPLAGVERPGFAFSLIPADQSANAPGRAMELESHLRRIARELAATGVLPELIGLPSATRLPEMTGLSTREIEIVTRLVRGERVPLIAKAMFLSQSTVRNHLTSVYRKLGVGSQQELITLLRVSDDGYDEDPPIAL